MFVPIRLYCQNATLRFARESERQNVLSWYRCCLCGHTLTQTSRQAQRASRRVTGYSHCQKSSHWQRYVVWRQQKNVCEAPEIRTGWRRVCCSTDRHHDCVLRSVPTDCSVLCTTYWVNRLLLVDTKHCATLRHYYYTLILHDITDRPATLLVAIKGTRIPTWKLHTLFAPMCWRHTDRHILHFLIVSHYR
jgi:hypothetical protein